MKKKKSINLNLINYLLWVNQMVKKEKIKMDYKDYKRKAIKEI